MDQTGQPHPDEICPGQTCSAFAAIQQQRPCAPETITYDLITPIGSVGFTVDDWLTGPVTLSTILDFLRYGLRPPERARGA
ncbi:hypothetical protein ElyMa_004509600 [Elysia marginata]|uniref:Uncharacterized protein n=1 Tax=Elysia marginata TaxID=1093978 RepID=A0AAV4HNR6_9GAST|nr:hypothetical protein ElyMa_004509600 [Elysia marginata]